MEIQGNKQRSFQIEAIASLCDNFHHGPYLSLVELESENVGDNGKATLNIGFEQDRDLNLSRVPCLENMFSTFPCLYAE